MKIKVKPNDLTKKLKALDHQMVASDDPIPEKNHFVWGVSGMKGSGKTSLLINVMRTHLRKTYDHIFLFSPTARVDTKWKDMVDELDPEGKYYEEYNEGNLLEVIERIKQLNEDDKNNKNLIIFDDCMSEFKAGQKTVMNRLITTCRHLKTSVVIIVQKYNRLSTTIRANMDMVSIFATQNQRELNTIIDDINVNPDTFKQIYEYCVGDGGNRFIHVTLFQAKLRFYKCFDRIEIVEED